MWKSLAAFSVALFAACALGLPAFPRDSEAVNSAASQRIIVLPFHTNQDGRMLIDGTVDTTPGVFLFDTGDFDAFSLNRNYVPLEPGTERGQAHAASGQSWIMEVHPKPHIVSLAGRLHVPARGDVNSTTPDLAVSIDAKQQQENIDPHLLGSIGWGFLRDYVFTIDFATKTIMLDPIGKDVGGLSYNKGAATIRFTPSSPVVPFVMDIAGRSIPSIIDTGGWDRLALSDDTWAMLEKSGILSKGPGVGCVNVSSASYGGSHFSLSDLEKVRRTDQRLTLGYNFLYQYKSTWNPKRGTVTLTRNNVPQRPRTISCS
jgi:hypothetical protein